MPLPELRWRLRDQTLHRRLSKWEIILKDFSNAWNATNKLARRVKNLRTRLAKENIQISIDQLRDRKQIKPDLVHKSDINQGKVVIYLDDVGTEAPYHSCHPQKSRTPCVTREWDWRTISYFWSCVLSNQNPWATYSPGLRPSSTQDEKRLMAQCWG
jgi:hypothetical protein